VALLSPWPLPSFTANSGFTFGITLAGSGGCGSGGCGFNVTISAITTNTPAIANSIHVREEEDPVSVPDCDLSSLSSTWSSTGQPVDVTLSPSGDAGHRSLRLWTPSSSSSN
jgi:hypothetical protein